MWHRHNHEHECENYTPTHVDEVFDSFESTFQDKVVVPDDLRDMWLRKAIREFSTEVSPLSVNEEGYFESRLSANEVDVLGMLMKLYYQERQVSKVNKRASIVTRDFSFDGTNGTKNSEKAHLEWVQTRVKELLDNLKPTAYA